ncbi:tigger transposable element-derived protein 4-like [Agrilus planipennis]|uniref:Tigger transposable element-derived protein 4-like n=1 Tax=Agrilus planipennis TaxID=224129 RepID=A0A1W4WGD3_AGRPL|nr:tigger transposable element-derived protein 4-like [Agrilus planipennis]
MAGNKRKILSIEQKISLIHEIEQGEKKSDVGRRYGLTPSTVSTIWKCKDKVLQAELQGCLYKKLRKPKFEDLDRAMVEWLETQRIKNVLITGPILKSKAKMFAEQLGIKDFKASEGWLGKFKHRHELNYGPIIGETCNVSINEILEIVKKEEVDQDDAQQLQTGESEPPTFQEALDATKLLKKFFLFYGEDSSALQDVSRVHSKVQALCLHNKKVQNYKHFFTP